MPGFFSVQQKERELSVKNPETFPADDPPGGGHPITRRKAVKLVAGSTAGLILGPRYVGPRMISAGVSNVDVVSGMRDSKTDKRDKRSRRTGRPVRSALARVGRRVASPAECMIANWAIRMVGGTDWPIVVGRVH